MLLNNYITVREREKKIKEKYAQFLVRKTQSRTRKRRFNFISKMIKIHRFQIVEFFKKKSEIFSQKNETQFTDKNARLRGDIA